MLPDFEMKKIHMKSSLKSPLYTMLRAQEDVTCVMQKHISLSFVKARVGLGCAHFLFEAFRETLCFST